jgi:hypothetical protein
MFVLLVFAFDFINFVICNIGSIISKNTYENKKILDTVKSTNYVLFNIKSNDEKNKNTVKTL